MIVPAAGWASNGTSTSKALSGLAEGTTYYWHVRAVNDGGTTYSNGLDDRLLELHNGNHPTWGFQQANSGEWGNGTAHQSYPDLGQQHGSVIATSIATT